MSKFRLLDTRRCPEPGYAEFVVQWLEGDISEGERFTVYDTHHPIEVSVVGSIAHPGGAILRCAVALGWDGQFASSIVDTSGPSRSEAFRYETRRRSDAV